MPFQLLHKFLARLSANTIIVRETALCIQNGFRGFSGVKSDTSLNIRQATQLEAQRAVNAHEEIEGLGDPQAQILC